MKKNIEKKALKVMASVVRAEMNKQDKGVAICPAIFHQPKRPQKSKLIRP